MEKNKARRAVTRYTWAKAILDLNPNQQQQIAKHLLPAKIRDFPTPPVRSRHSGLDCSKFEQAFHQEIPDWRYSLNESMKKSQPSP